MFQSLSIQNFQPHEKRLVEFDPLVTVFVGGTDVGKSSIIRALYWVCFNQPSGTEFITRGKEFTKVELVVDKHIVTRQRGVQTNWYKLDKSKPFKALGQGGVPESVSNLLNVSTDNFQLQLDPPFLLSLTSGQISSALNEIINLSEIDETFSNLDSELRQSRSKHKVIEERLAEAKADKLELSWVLDADSKLKQLEKKEKELLELSKKRERLEYLVTVLEEAEKASSVPVPNTNELDKLKQQWEETKGQRERLADLLGRLKEAETLVCDTRKLAEESKKEMKKLTESRCPLCNRPM